MKASRKIPTLVLTLVMVVTSGSAFFVAPPKTHAVLPVTDAIHIALNKTKEWVFDTLAWQVANLAIESVTKSLVNWINSGFQGSPAFITDLNRNLRGLGDTVAKQFFNELSVAYGDIELSPFQNRVLDAVRLGYYLHTSPESFYTRYPYTLNQVSPDARAFLQGDFNQGGWNAWFATVMNPQNNPYGAQQLAEETLSNIVAGATGNRVQELSWNRGFLSWRGDCPEPEGDVQLSGEEPCIGQEIRTPGSVIEQQLNAQIGAGGRRLEVADEMNEIIGALLNQLVLQVLGKGGLRGVSSPSSGGGGSFLNNPTGGSSAGGGSTGTGTGTVADPTIDTTVQGIGATFEQMVLGQRTQIMAYQGAWERIRNAARTAAQYCPAGGNPDPHAALERANQALIRAETPSAKLIELGRRITEANQMSGNQSVLFLAISNEYNALISSPVFPTPEEFAEAASMSADTGTQEPASLYTQLVRMANGSCNGT